MRIEFLIPATDAIRRVVKYKAMPNARRSYVKQAEVSRHTDLQISGDFDALINQESILAEAGLSLGNINYQMMLDRDFDSGHSWKLPVALMHASIATGLNDYFDAKTGEPTGPPELVVWSTGAFCHDLTLDVGPYQYQAKLALLLSVAAALVNQSSRLIILLPPDQSALQQSDLGQRLTTLGAQFLIASNLRDILQQLSAQSAPMRAESSISTAELLQRRGAPKATRRFATGRRPSNGWSNLFLLLPILLSITGFAYISGAFEQFGPSRDPTLKPTPSKAPLATPATDPNLNGPATSEPEPMKNEQADKTPLTVQAPDIGVFALRSRQGVSCIKLVMNDHLILAEPQHPVTTDQFEIDDLPSLCGLGLMTRKDGGHALTLFPQTLRSKALPPRLKRVPGLDRPLATLFFKKGVEVEGKYSVAVPTNTDSAMAFTLSLVSGRKTTATAAHDKTTR